jgi:hypothetical protein
MITDTNQIPGYVIDCELSDQLKTNLLYLANKGFVVSKPVISCNEIHMCKRTFYGIRKIGSGLIVRIIVDSQSNVNNLPFEEFKSFVEDDNFEQFVTQPEEISEETVIPEQVIITE